MKPKGRVQQGGHAATQRLSSEEELKAQFGDILINTVNVSTQLP